VANISTTVEQPKKGKTPWGCILIILATFALLSICVLSTLFVLAVSDPDFEPSSLSSDKYKESSYQDGDSEQKIAIIPLKGIITSQTEESGFLTSVSATPKDFYGMLDKAIEDPDVKAIVIDMDTPGGEVLATDLMYTKLKR
jgi:protease-4